MQRWLPLMGALVLLLRASMLASAAWGNVGMLALRDELMAQADVAPGAYPVYEALDETAATARVMQTLRRAVALDEDSLAARWALGRAALAMGDGEAAADALRPLTEGARRNPLLYDDALTAFSHGWRPAEVVALYEAVPPPQWTSAVSDTVALAYLEGSIGAREQGGRGALERVRELRPGDLYANYHLWMQARQDGDLGAAAAYSETLTYFPLEAIDPGDERLLDYVAEAILALLEDGLWDRDKTLNVVSFLVWQHNGATGVERLLEQLTERYPTEPEWPFYLAELYHRRGDLDHAEAAYQQVLAVDPEYAQAYLCIGMLYETRAEGETGE